MHRWTWLLVLLVGWWPCAALAQPNASDPSSTEGDAAAEPGSSASDETTAPPPAASSSAPKPSPRPATLLDRSTPRQTVVGFLAAVERDDLSTAIRYLDLGGLRWNEHSPQEAARQLAQVLERRIWLNPNAVSDVPAGLADDGEDLERIATVDVKGTEVPITLARVPRGTDAIWLFSQTTVNRIPELSQATGSESWVSRVVPEAWQGQRVFGLWTWQWWGLLLSMLFGIPIGYIAATLLARLFVSVASRTQLTWDDKIARALRGPLRFGGSWVLMGAAMQTLDLPPRFGSPLRILVQIPLILATGWALVRVVRALVAHYLETVPDDQEMNTRGIRTQLVIIRKVATGSISLLTFALALMQFEVVRNVGWSLLASAGVAGVALGFAAQRSLGAVIAGIQLSVTQPIRIGDVVVWQDQWGTVEEIALTFVRLKLWDERRLVVPVDKLLAEPFENWSQPGDSIIGVVELSVDPTAPIDRIRAHFEALISDLEHHDGREALLQVIASDERRVLIRLRVSTDDIVACHLMKCALRESMLAYLRDLDGGRYLPRQRWMQTS